MSSQFRTVEVSDPQFSHEGLHYITVKSAHLAGRGDITVYVPEGTSGPLPLVLLLHGVYGSHWAWTLKGGVHRTAKRLADAGKCRPLALAMPSDGLFGDGSGYLAHSSRDFEKWIVEDVPSVVAEVFPNIQPRAAGLFIAGLSMGGYGALRLGARYPRTFQGFAGHSSITEPDQLGTFVEEPVSTYRTSDPEDASVLAQLVKHRHELPSFRFDCGLNDPLLPYNRALHTQLLDRGIPHLYEEHEGEHAWDYWKIQVEKTLLFFSNQLEKPQST